jgi:hypothetical protein
MAQGKSTVIAASAAISAKAGRVLGVGITAGADAASVKIMDGGASGTQKTATLNAAIGVSQYQSFPNGIQCSTSIYATITGTTPEVMVIYED